VTDRFASVVNSTTAGVVVLETFVVGSVVSMSADKMVVATTVDESFTATVALVPSTGPAAVLLLSAGAMVVSKPIDREDTAVESARVPDIVAVSTATVVAEISSVVVTDAPVDTTTLVECCDVVDTTVHTLR